jgi:hypothetical protein
MVYIFIVKIQKMKTKIIKDSRLTQNAAHETTQPHQHGTKKASNQKQEWTQGEI